MKIALIHGQDRKQTSYQMGRAFVSHFPNAEISEFFAPRELDKFCRGCFTCLHERLDACPHAQTVRPFTKAMLEADLLVFTTPVYCQRMSAGLKNLFEHHFIWFMVHRPRPEMFHKKAAVLTCAAGMGMRNAVKDVKVNLMHWGISEIATVQFRSMATTWDEVAQTRKDALLRKIQQAAERINRSAAQVSFSRKILFLIMRTMQIDQKGSPEDRLYWEEMGWLGQKRPW